MGMANALKMAAAAQRSSSPPAAFMFGEVLTISPLSVRVDNRFDIDETALVVPLELQPGVRSTHTHTIAKHKHEVLDIEKETDEIELITETITETHFGLAVGERVILLRNDGGQEYLIIGRA